jgi:hypothetical protein
MSGKVIVLLTSISTNNRVVTINLKSENLSRGGYFRVSVLDKVCYLSIFEGEGLKPEQVFSSTFIGITFERNEIFS